MVPNKYIRLKDVLALIPENDLVGPKPSRLREEINKLYSITLLERENFDDLKNYIQEAKDV